MPIRKIEKMYDRLLKSLLEYQTDVKKFDQGNKAAGIRARRGMQLIRKGARDIRDAIQSVNRVKKSKQQDGDD